MGKARKKSSGGKAASLKSNRRKSISKKQRKDVKFTLNSAERKAIAGGEGDGKRKANPFDMVFAKKQKVFLLPLKVLEKPNKHVRIPPQLVLEITGGMVLKLERRRRRHRPNSNPWKFESAHSTWSSSGGIRRIRCAEACIIL
jgi:hypothetical protein